MNEKETPREGERGGKKDRAVKFKHGKWAATVAALSSVERESKTHITPQRPCHSVFGDQQCECHPRAYKIRRIMATTPELVNQSLHF